MSGQVGKLVQRPLRGSAAMSTKPFRAFKDMPLIGVDGPAREIEVKEGSMETPFIDGFLAGFGKLAETSADPMAKIREALGLEKKAEAETQVEENKSLFELWKEAAKKEKKWIKGAIKKPGALHAQMGVPEGRKIPTDRLRAAAKKSGKLGQRARLAVTLKKMHKD